eukprot:TRINITY_DN7496_c0_g1_i3.p1 TRINITY_DN7496_c0_g1~~TRINITY_DN7496_c0_g1_i3.p1  ORF type:complete len:738 (+),score=219.18 TRINITY_DN7496_c0_g1_i3:88-2301(+)
MPFAKAVDLEKTWTSIESVLLRLLNPKVGHVKPRQFQFMFGDVHSLTNARPKSLSKELYAKLEAFLASYMQELAKTLEKEQGSNFLRLYQEKFDHHYTVSEYISNGFGHLNTEIARWRDNTTFGRSKAEHLPVFDLIMQHWADHVCEALHHRVVARCLHEIAQHREGHTVNLFVVHGVLASIMKMTSHQPSPVACYVQFFETPFLEQTEAYFRQQSQAKLVAMDMASFMVFVIKALDEEARRCRECLQIISIPKAMAIAERELITANQDRIVAECAGYLERKQQDELRNTYLLLKRPDLLQPLIDAFQEHVTTTGKTKVQGLVKPVTSSSFIEVVVALHVEFTALVADAFHNDPLFIEALDKSCAIVVNQRHKGSTATAAEMLAKVCDSTLKKTSKGLGDDEIEARLSEYIAVFQYVHDKDVFQKFYAKMLAKRLIHSTSASEEAERFMIGQLKNKCGYEYTAKLQRMFQDVRVSADINRNFNSSLGQSLGYSFNALVLQTGAWPLSAPSSTACTLPSELASAVEKFKLFYDQSHTGRRLTWLYYLSNGDIKAKLGKKSFDFSATTYQMIVLLMLNDQDTITAEQVHAATTLATKDVDKTLHSLVTCHLLKPAEPDSYDKSKPLAPTDVFNLNLKYNSKKKKVKISAAVAKDTAAESSQTHKAVGDDRKMFLQAVTVRVMKMRKTMKYNMLIKEVIDMASSRFKPTIPNIKKCIEDLIDKGYMQRAEEDRSQLSYIA